MPRVTLHIGAHKTGTSYIQKRLEHSVGCLPKGYGIIPRANKTLVALTTLTRKLRSVSQAHEQADEIASLAQNLARQCKNERTLISHEDILGPVPTRGNIHGLYPYIDVTLPAVLRGFHAANTVVEVVMYVRDYEDWLGSVFRYRFRKVPERVYIPRRFKANNDLPENWDGFLGRVRMAVGDNPLHILSFEEDRSRGDLGTSLFSIFGLSQEIQASFVPVVAQNVTRYATVIPSLNGED